MYRIHICDSGYKVLCAVVRAYAQKCMEGDKTENEKMTATLGCMLLLDELNQATHIEDKK